MKLLLISLQSNAYTIGLKYVAASAHSHGHDVRILLLPGYLEPTLAGAIDHFVIDYNPDLIGISLMSIEFHSARNITRLLRQKFETPIIWGGAHAVLKPEESLKYADFVCIGEGERAIVLLLEHLINKGRDVPPDIPNIWANVNGKISNSSKAQAILDLDRLPFQEYLPPYFYVLHKEHIFNFSKNEPLFRKYALYGGTCHMLLSTRGCPFHCSYCGNSAFVKIYGKKIRERSVSNIIGELKEVIKNPYVLYINIQDDCFFSHGHKWIEAFSDLYKTQIGLPFLARVIPSMIDRDKFLMLREAGLSWVVMGIQSGSDHVNFDIYNRKIRFSSVKKAANIISKTRTAPLYEMIVDNPYETENERMETIDRMADLQKPYIISLAHLTFLPGTSLTERAVRDNIVSRDDFSHNYLLQYNLSYLNKLLGITPYIPRHLAKKMNKQKRNRSSYDAFVVNILFGIITRIVEPAVYFIVSTRALNYSVIWTIETMSKCWKSAVSKIFFHFLGRGDLTYARKLGWAKKNMPELFEE